MAMVADGPLCACGQHGCWEALAAGPALARAAAAAIAGDEPTLLRGLAGAVSGRHVSQAARAGDAVALRLLRQEAAWLGRGFANLLHLYSPEAILVGGGVASALDLMLPGITATMRAAAMPAYHGATVMPAALGADAGLIGAASLLWPAT